MSQNNGTGLHQVIVVSCSQKSPKLLHQKAPSSTRHVRLCRTSIGIVRALSPGAWEAGKTLLMSLSEDSSPLSQLQVLDDVRECHIQGHAGPGPIALVHYIIYITIFLLLLILLKAITDWFGMEGSFRGYLGWTCLQ